jgi:predicted GIY-YIG superfamily endonuclease
MIELQNFRACDLSDIAVLNIRNSQPACYVIYTDLGHWYIGVTNEIREHIQQTIKNLHNNKHNNKKLQELFNPPYPEQLRLRIFEFHTREEACQYKEDLIIKYKKDPLLLNAQLDNTQLVFGIKLNIVPTEPGCFIIKTADGYYYVATVISLRTGVKAAVSRLLTNQHNNKQLQKIFNSNTDQLELSWLSFATEEEAELYKINFILKNENDKYLLNVFNYDIFKVFGDSAFGLKKEPACYTVTTEEGEFYVGSSGTLYKRIHKHARTLIEQTHGNSPLQDRYNLGHKLTLSYTLFDTAEQAIAAETELLYIYKDDPKLLNRAKHDGSMHEISKQLNRDNDPNTKQVIIDGVIYPSMKNAAKAKNVSAQTISHRTNSSNPAFSEYSYIKTSTTSSQTF